MGKRTHDSEKCFAVAAIGPTEVNPLLPTPAIHILYERALGGTAPTKSIEATLALLYSSITLLSLFDRH